MIQILYNLKYSKNLIEKLVKIGKIIHIKDVNKNIVKNAAIFINDNLNIKDLEKIIKKGVKFLYVIIILHKKTDPKLLPSYFNQLSLMMKNKGIDLFYEVTNLENLDLNLSAEKFFSLIIDNIYLKIQDIEFIQIPSLFVQSLKEYLYLEEVCFISLNPFNEIIKSFPINCNRQIKDIFKKNILLYKAGKEIENRVIIEGKDNDQIFLFSIYNNPMTTSFCMIYFKINKGYVDILKTSISNKIIRILDYINNKLITYYRLQRNIQEINVLHNVSVAFGATSSLDELIDIIVKKAKNVFKADVCTLMLIENNELYIKYSIGLPEEVKGVRQKIGEGIAGKVAQTGKPLIINDIDKVEDKFELEKNYKSSMVVPLKAKEGKTIGVLSVSKNSFYPFSENDMQTLYNLATVAATAIEKAQLYQNLNLYSEKLEESYINTIKSLAKAFEARDKYNKGHMERVLKYGLAIASEIDSSLLNDDVLKLSLLFHDIGKIEIPDSILNKPSKLTPEEYEVIKRHPEAGEEILRNVKFLQEVAEIVKQHQERWDGKGYPQGLKGEEIHLYARIVALADAFDAMTSDRVYRKAMSIEEAVEEIKRNRGTQFDPMVVDAFLRAYEAGLIKVDEEINEEIIEMISIKNLRER